VGIIRRGSSVDGTKSTGAAVLYANSRTTQSRNDRISDVSSAFGSFFRNFMRSAGLRNGKARLLSASRYARGFRRPPSSSLRARAAVT
jgi:hypothetical protein